MSLWKWKFKCLIKPQGFGVGCEMKQLLTFFNLHLLQCLALSCSGYLGLNRISHNLISEWWDCQQIHCSGYLVWTFLFIHVSDFPSKLGLVLYLWIMFFFHNICLMKFSKGYWIWLHSSKVWWNVRVKVLVNYIWPSHSYFSLKFRKGLCNF